MKSWRIFGVLAFLLAQTALAQVSGDPEFWRSGDVRTTDNLGKLIHAIVKDREHYTARVFSDGQWIEYRYAPHTERVVGITGPDTVEEILYDAHGAYTGKNMRFAGLSFALRGDQRDHFKAGDMPAITLQRDADGRVTNIVTESGDTIADIHFVDGHPDVVQLDGGAKISIAARERGGYREVLTGPTGKVLDDRIVTDTLRRKPAENVVLDVVAQHLALPPNWKEVVTTRWNSTGSVQVVNDRAGNAVLYVTRDGAYTAGFDKTGKALFYDVSADLFVGRTSHPQDLPNLEALVPTRFSYTRDGRSGAYVPTPALGAIQAFWSERDAAGGSVVKFRFSAPGTSPGRSQGATSLEPVPARKFFRLAALDFCVIDYQVTTYEDGSQSTTILGVTCFYFGGGGSGGGTGSGGGGSSGYSTNTTTGLKTQAVNNSLQRAQAKLQTQQCSDLLNQFTNPATGTTLFAVMQQRGYGDAGTYLTQGVSYKDGQYHQDQNGAYQCANGGVYAWVFQPGLTTVWVCDRFKDLAGTPGMGAVYLIHELLHVLGLPEGGNGLTSDQITNMVKSACGT